MPEHLRKLVRASIRAALADGELKEVQITEPKQTETTARWKINGRLKNGTPINLTLEFSRRGMPPPAHVEQRKWQANGEGRMVWVDVYDLQSLAFAKTAALCAPSRTKPRDLYDLHVLIAMEVEPPVELLRRFPKERLQEMHANLWRKIDQLSWGSFEKEVAPHLPEGMRSRIDRETWETMRLETGEQVQSWLEAAMDGPEP